jgi:hypothetical protein
MPIFISHTTKDDALAQDVVFRLKYIHGITCYIDDIDKELANNRGKSSLTPLLVDRLRKCDTLLAVVTENTKRSWWVPFEIGTAREMPRVITSFTHLPEPSQYSSQESLPEYLLEWPRLRTNREIDIFAGEYKRKSTLLEKSASMENFSQKSPSVDAARNFEATIMRSLGQRKY